MKGIIKRFVIIPLLLLVAGCVNEDGLNHSNNDNGIYSLKVQMPESDNPTRVDLTQVEGTKDLKATWRAYEKVLVLLTQGDKDFNTGTWNVSEISEDGKQATIYFGLPDGINQKKPFTVYGFTGIEATVQYYEDKIWHPRCMAALLRAPIEKFKAPMFAQVEANYGQTSITSFHHFGTYELLHVKNNSNESVSIAHNGFDIDMPWYQAAAFVEPNDGNGPVKPFGEWDGEDFSDSQTIAAGAEGVFISWYIPSGFPITEAHLLASVNGKEISSANTFSSEVSLQRGHAYHMYATWDGENLSFDKGKQKFIKVEPTKIEFGDVPVGTTKTEHFTVSNVGTANLTFNVSNQHSVIDIPESGKEFTLAPGEDKVFEVTFTPTNPNSGSGAAVRVFSDAENGTQYINISGNGIEGGDPSCPVAEAIDLGLPSGTLWASWNVGASKPEEYGGYYAWGETEEKDYYDWETYTHYDGSSSTCHQIGDDIAGTEYDVAHVKWGGSWRMPTRAQQDELRENCTCEWTQLNGVNGIKVTGPNGNTIFLPAAGCYFRGYLDYKGSDGRYWSSSHTPGFEVYAYYLYFTSDVWAWNLNHRLYGQSVRAVCVENDGLVENGDFSSGTDGFTSDYEYISETGNYALVREGTYTIGTSPRQYHIDFVNHGDHTTGNGNMLIVNGAIDNNKYVWKKTFFVEKGKTYEFSAWFLNVCMSNVLDKNMIEYNINGIPITGAYDITENGWDRFIGTFTATETGSIEIKIRSKSSEHGGNDFAIDDIYFSHLHSFDE